MWLWALAALAAVTAALWLGQRWHVRPPQAAVPRSFRPAALRRLSTADLRSTVEELLIGLGCSVERAPCQGGRGVDLLAVDESGKRLAIQVLSGLRQADQQVIANALEGASHYTMQQTVVVAVAGVTDGGLALAQQRGVVLWEPGDLRAVAEEIQSQAHQAAKPPMPAPAITGRRARRGSDPQAGR